VPRKGSISYARVPSLDLAQWFRRIENDSDRQRYQCHHDRDRQQSPLIHPHKGSRRALIHQSREGKHAQLAEHTAQSPPLEAESLVRLVQGRLQRHPLARLRQKLWRTLLLRCSPQEASVHRLGNQSGVQPPAKAQGSARWCSPSRNPMVQPRDPDRRLIPMVQPREPMVQPRAAGLYGHHQQQQVQEQLSPSRFLPGHPSSSPQPSPHQGPGSPQPAKWRGCSSSWRTRKGQGKHCKHSWNSLHDRWRKTSNNHHHHHHHQHTHLPLPILLPRPTPFNHPLPHPQPMVPPRVWGSILPHYRHHHHSHQTLNMSCGKP